MFLRLLSLFVLLSIPAFARQSYSNWCQQGNQTVTTSGVASTTKVQRSYSSCTVTVYVSGTLTLATLYSDNSGTAKANPFTANVGGNYIFYASNGRYDIVTSGAGQATPFTISDVLLFDGPSANAVSSLNGLTGDLSIVPGTSGTDFAVASSGTTITLNLPTASASSRGALSSADWIAFNAKQAGLSFTAPLNLTGTTVSLNVPLDITYGGTNAVTATTAFNNLSPLTTKGDLLGHNGTNNIRIPKGTDGYVLTSDSGQASGLNWVATVSAIPVTVSQGGTGVTSITGVPIGAGTSPLTAVAASSVLQTLRRKINVSSTTYEFASPPYLVSSDFDFPAQQPGGTLTAAVGATPTLTPCPSGVSGTDTGHYVYISGGTGTVEAVLITGGTCTSGASTGTLGFTPANNHSGAWTVTSATSGLQEAVCFLSYQTNTVQVPQGTTTLNANVSFCGKTAANIKLSPGVTLAGSGVLPTVAAAGTYISNGRTGLLHLDVSANISSAATIAPVSGMAHVTGTTTIDTITPPSGFTSGCIVLIPDGLWSTSNAGNIAIASTGVVSKALIECYDPGTSKWYPSY